MTRTTHDVIHIETGAVLGSVNLNTGPRKDVNGWWFISHVSSHANGRKPKATAAEAIPQWAKKMGSTLD